MSFLRNLFSRRSDTENASATATLPPPQAPPTPAAQPRPEPAPALASEECVPFPLKAITDLFTPELKPFLHKQPSEHVQVQIPRALIQPQLAAGAVRITFAQLRAATPEIFFNPEGAPGDAKVLLPLEHVLKQLAPLRRDDQRQPAIPVNVPSIFLKAGQSGAPGAAKEAWYSQRRPTYETPPESPPESQQPEPKTASTPVPAVSKKSFQPLSSITERPRRGDSRPAGEGAGSNGGVRRDTVAVPLPEVLAALPEDIRHALNAADARAGSFVIPLSEIETRMRTGKLLFKCEELRGWCSVELSAAAPPDEEIELPLAAVVPLFMAARGAREKRKQVEVSDKVPDLFSKSKTVAPAEPAATPAPEPVATPAPAPAPFRLAAAEPVPGPAAPAQIVERLRALDGVTGAFIATADGLLVAGDTQVGNENVLAAFAPTVFVQLTKYADMARLGLPDSIDIHLSNLTVHVRKAGQLYLGALLADGKPLPVQEFIRISNALQPQKT